MRMGYWTTNDMGAVTFEVATCESCKEQGKVFDSFRKQKNIILGSKDDMFKVVDKEYIVELISLYYKKTITNYAYDLLCLPCIETIEMIEPKKASNWRREDLA